MLCGWIFLAALGQATQPAPNAANLADGAVTTRPAALPNVIIVPPTSAATQPAGAASQVGRTHQPANSVNRDVPTTPPFATTPVPAAAASQPAVRVYPQTPAPTNVAAKQPTPVTPGGAETVVVNPAASPQAADAAAELLAKLKAAQAAQPIAAATTQPSGVELPALSGEEVDIEVTSDGKIVLRGNPRDVEILQQFIGQLQRQTVPPTQVQIFSLKNARATDINANLQKFWTEAKSPGPGQALSPENRISIVPEPRSNSLMIAASPENMLEVADLITRLDQSTVQMQFYLRQLKNIKADEAKKIIDAFLANRAKALGNPAGPLADITAEARTNSLLISAPPDELKQIETMITLIDVEPSLEAGTSVRIAFFPLEKAVANDLLTVLQNMLNTSKSATNVQEEIRRLQLTVHDPRGGPDRQLSALNLEKPIKLLADPGTNSIIVASIESNLAPIGEIIRLLDKMPISEELLVRIYPLTNADATTLQTFLKDMFTQGKTVSEVPGKTQVQGRTPTVPAGSALINNVVLSVDLRTNALIVGGRLDQLLLVEQVVKAIDVPNDASRFPPRLVHLDHSDPTKLSAALQKIVDARQAILQKQGPTAASREQVLLIPDPRTNSLIIVAKEDNYDEMAKLVKDLDQSGAAYLGQLHIITLNKESATDLAPKITQMWKDRAATHPEAATDQPVINTDARSNSLIVASNQEDFEVIRKLADQLEQTEPSNTGTARFFPLKYADAVRVADMLDQLFQGMQAASPTLKEQLQIKVVPNTRTNTLVVSGAPFALERAASLIPQLDQPQTPGGPTAETEVYHLKNAPSPRIAQVLTDMIKNMTSGAGGAGAKATPVNVAAEETSNSLIVNAPHDQQDIIKGLLVQLDVPSALSNQIAVIPLKQAKAEQISDTLTKLMQQQAQGGTGTKAPPGFAITPETRTNSLVVFAPPDIMTNIREIILHIDTATPAAHMALRVFPLHNSKSDDLAKLLNDFFKAAGAATDATGKDVRQMIINFSPIDPITGKPLLDPKTGQQLIQRLVHQDITMTSDPNTNALVVLAPEGSIDMMSMLVEMLDSVTPVTAQVQVFPLQNADATQMQKLLSDLFASKGSGGGSGSTTPRQLVLTGEGGGSVAATAGGTSGVTDVVFGVDERTNSLIAAGSPSYLKIVENLVLRLDLKEMEERAVRVVHLRNAKATDVSKTMKAYFQDESTAISKASQNEPSSLQLQRTVTIEDSGETSNSLLLSYSPRMESQIISMINELDQPPPQVMIQVLMAEVTLNESFELGMEFALQDLLFSTHAVTQATPNGTLIRGNNFDTVFGTDVGAAGSGNGLNFTVTGQDFNFLFHALQTEGRLEVLSRPSVLVRDNQKATFTVGERVPTVQSITQNANGIVTPEVTYEEVGVILNVTPIINPDGFVNMDIAPEISGIGTSSVTVSTGVTLPTFTERKAETSVTVKDGETIIIGGLITNQTNTSDTKVPLAGDVPILGWAFRANKRDTTKTELLIVITPHVIRDPTQARAVSINMRDQTGLNDNVRESPLMQGLQVRPEEDQFGPIEPIKPGSNLDQPSNQRTEEQGPELEEYGPPVNGVRPISSIKDDEFGPAVVRTKPVTISAAAH